MDTLEKAVINTEADADTQAVLDHVLTGKPLNPEVARRIHERADRVRQAILQNHGVVDIGVPAIRALRGELPQA